MVGVAAADSLALSSGQFATKLSAVLQPGDFFSPASIQHALALVAAGASGQTLAELQSALLWPMSPNWQQELGAFFAGLYEAMAAGEPVLSVANRVYTKVPVKPEYAAAVSSVFHATIEPLTTADNINNFVSEATRGMIKEIVKDEHVQSSVLIAVNALYFKGKWAVCFDAARTTIAPFRSLAQPSTCHMMQTPAEKKWRYYEDAHAQYIMLPYRDAAGAESSLVALVALPRAETANALASVDWPQVLQALGGHEKRKGTLWMPRFALESTMHLSEALKSLGATRAFSTSAEFPLRSSTTFTSIDAISVLARGDAIQTTLAMLEHVGQPTDVGIAFTEAFETLLVNELVGWWTDEDAATLSAAFTVAFGQELTPRLDMEHAIRSRALSPSEVEWLRQLPQCIVFNKNLINVFQGTAS